MPQCNPRCPVVKTQLRKLATEAPWVLKELATRSDLKVSSLIETADGKIISAAAGARPGEDQRSSIDTYDPSDPRYKDKKDAMGEHPGDKTVAGRKIRTSATQWNGTKEGLDPLVKTDISKLLEPDKVHKANGVDGIGVDRTDRASGVDRIGVDGTDRASGVDRIGADRTDRASGIDTIDSADKMDRTDRASSASKLDDVKKMDKETLKREVTDKSTEFAVLPDECEESCPRRISRKSRLRKLEEMQCIIDSYILNKGTRYFEDVCTCSLSCVFRALKHDPFVTSTLASITLFTLGLKLCSELDAWYLPIQFS